MILGVAIALLIGMLVLVIFEALVPSGATPGVTLYAFIGYCLLVFAGILALRVLLLVFRPGAD